MQKIKKAIEDGSLKVDRQDRKPWPRFSDEDRVKLYRRCGDKCFLLVKGDAKDIIDNPKKALKFPVCRVPSKKNKCSLSASGLLAANRRARLTKQYPELVEQTKTLIQQLGTTAVSRKAMEKKAIRLQKSKEDPKKFVVTLLFRNGMKEKLQKPLSVRSIKGRYLSILSDSQKKKLGL